ncbi:hypothetical protein IWW55_000069 [Coemansia sp. RSA 2706]|nr:hypothetical protein IWW55_000069 [Coemansia sp. RSA 2706]
MYITNGDDMSIYTTSPEDETLHLEFDTNASLIAGLGNTELVQYIGIHLNYVRNPVPGLQKIAQMIRNNAQAWPRIRHLEVSMNFNQVEATRAGQDIARFIIESKKLVSELVNLLPNISQLSLPETRSNAFNASVYNQLASAYAPQLTMLCSNIVTIFDDAAQLAQLTCLNIQIRPNMLVSVPKLAAATLQNLTLRNVPADYTWDDFASSSSDSQVWFTSLQTLTLTFNRTSKQTIRDTAVTSLHFPRLKILRVYAASGESRGFFKLSKFSALDVLDLAESPVELKPIGQLSFQVTRVLRLTANFPWLTNQKHGFQAINRFIDKTESGALVELNVTNNIAHVDVDAGNITNGKIAHLCISGAVSVETLVGIISTLPRLKVLIVAEVNSEATFIVPNIPPPNGHGALAIQPLNVQLESLSLDFNWVGNSTKMHTGLIKCLILSLPRLQWLAIEQGLLPQILAFIAAYQHAYPHLASLRLRPVD